MGYVLYVERFEWVFENFLIFYYSLVSLNEECFLYIYVFLVVGYNLEGYDVFKR